MTVAAVTLISKMSSAATLVVHPDKDVDLTALPVVKSGGSLATIEEEGNDVPVAIFLMSSVQVGDDPSAIIDHADIVPANFALIYLFEPVSITAPIPSKTAGGVLTAAPLDLESNCVCIALVTPLT